nr:immunoglobulin light chain junction region [Macaca mulatta]MOV66466.1 immunoglobulin light chain junction region [Macaca mulatta]MOV66601.1 immunoglobulin light chain junction region [Macaca mulatta]MOV66776.1 immunoglobulin light chain junction region [Macaca mulatta]MOV66812.1 immunoglobulin light chain junction region [Macaca mulatta]
DYYCQSYDSSSVLF